MADQLMSNDHMMSANNIRPWHGIGTILENLATANEAIEAAKLGWTVESRDIAWLNDNGEVGGNIRGERASVRSDDGSVLGIVGENYEILQNPEAFSFFDSVAEKGEAIYETAGSLFGGRVVFITAKIPGLIRVGSGDDVTEKYLLLANSHDGSGAVRIKLVNTRVVCNNTLTAALKENGGAFSIRHTSKMKDRVEKAHEAMGIANKRFEKLGEMYNAFAKHELSDLDAKIFLERVFEDKPKRGKLLALPTSDNLIVDKESEEKEKNKRSIDAIGQIFQNEGTAKIPGQEEAGKTLWGAVNALTYWTNHVRTYKEQARSTNTREDNRVNSLLFGQSADLGAKALIVAQEMLKEGPSHKPVVGVGVDFDNININANADDNVSADHCETNDNNTNTKPVEVVITVSEDQANTEKPAAKKNAKTSSKAVAKADKTNAKTNTKPKAKTVEKETVNA